jgi:hypothetical protein
VRVPLFESWRWGECGSIEDLSRLLPPPTEARGRRLNPTNELFRRVHRPLANGRSRQAVAFERRGDLQLIFGLVLEVVLGGGMERETKAVDGIGMGSAAGERRAPIKLPVGLGARTLHQRRRADLTIELVVCERLRLVERVG